ncbi:MAG TPA: hypothetical protein VK824_04355, partial [Planctomycetota bacterium]|nr:hypothetical protein [Planctomycetota bacterium]
MVIYTLPGPIYNYSVGVNGFEPDTIDFDVKVAPPGRSLAGGDPPKAGAAQGSSGTAKVELAVRSTRGL